MPTQADWQEVPKTEVSPLSKTVNTLIETALSLLDVVTFGEGNEYVRGMVELIGRYMLDVEHVGEGTGENAFRVRNTMAILRDDRKANDEALRDMAKFLDEHERLRKKYHMTEAFWNAMQQVAGEYNE